MKFTQLQIHAILLVLVAHSCIVPKEARLLKKERKSFRDSPVVFEAYADSPLSGLFLTLRQNNTFEYTSSGILGSFQAGEWTHHGDSIVLLFRDREMSETGTELFLIDTNTRMLKRAKVDTPELQGMRIMLNTL